MAQIDTKKIRNLRLNSSRGNGGILLTNDIAIDLGISHKVVSRLENDPKYNPGVLTILKVADYFNVSIDSLIIKD